MDTVPLGPFKGMNNRLPDAKLSGEDGAFLRSAVNVDITSAGTVRRRQGVTCKIPGADCHSLWASGQDAYFVDFDTLYRISGTAESPVKTAVATGLTPGVPVSFTEINGEVFFSNGILLNRIGPDGVPVQNGIPSPNPVPLVSASVGGSLPGGDYQVACTYVADSGEQSGASQPVAVRVPDGGLIEITPQGPLPAGVDRVNIFVTSCNGDILYLSQAVTPGDTALVSVPPLLGERCVTQFMHPVPPGQIIRGYAGRLLSANGSTLYYSDAFNLGLYDPVSGYIPFPAPITVLEPCENGFYVVADKTYWFAGDITQAEVASPSPLSGVFGTGGSMPDRNSVFWFSSAGLVVGDQNGQVEKVQDANVATGTATSGAALFRKQDGLKQLLTSLVSPDFGVAAASSFMEAEVIRKENAQ